MKNSFSSYFDGKTQFSQIFLGCIFLIFFGGGGGGAGGGQISASFTCGSGLTEIIEGDSTC